MNSIAESWSWLTPYVRAWERHGVYFGLRSEASTDAQPFRTTCMSLDADRLPHLPARAEQMPQENSVAVVISGGPLTYRFSYAHHDRKKRGELNGDFLDPRALQDALLPAIEALAPRTNLVMLCLAPIYATENFPAHAFIGKLDRFLAGLPRSCRYAVGIRNPGFLLPDYCACLRSHGMAHLFDETAMPPLLDQILIPGILTAEHVVYRNTPTAYSGHAMDGGWELGVVEMIRRCIAEKKTCFLYLDEQAGAASLEALMTLLNADLARLSPLRKKAA